MAKKKVTDAQLDEAEPYVVAAAAGKLRRIGAARGVTRFRGDARAKRRATAKFLQQYADEGGKVGDWESFLTWLLEHGDELLAFVAKIITLFSVA